VILDLKQFGRTWESLKIFDAATVRRKEQGGKPRSQQKGSKHSAEGLPRNDCNVSDSRSNLVGCHSVHRGTPGVGGKSSGRRWQ